MWDERIRRDSCQNFLRKTPHSVTKSERMSCFSSPVSMAYAWNAWDHNPPFGDQNACILRLGLSNGSPSNKNTNFHRCRKFLWHVGCGTIYEQWFQSFTVQRWKVSWNADERIMKFSVISSSTFNNVTKIVWVWVVLKRKVAGQFMTMPRFSVFFFFHSNRK